MNILRVLHFLVYIRTMGFHLGLHRGSVFCDLFRKYYFMNIHEDGRNVKSLWGEGERE